MPNPSNKKIILITGASRGLGKVMYDYLSSVDEYQVYGTSREPGQRNLLQLDVRHMDSVKRCVSELMASHGRIDVLINNVGSNLIGSFESTSLEEIENEMSVNFYGAVRMIKVLLPCFRSQGHGKIINISSVGGRIALPYNSSYSASKAALEGFSEALDYELINSNIHISMVEPIALTIEDERPGVRCISDEMIIHGSSKMIYNKMKHHVSPSVSRLAVARKVHEIIRDPRPKLRYPVGLAGIFLIQLKHFLPWKVMRKIILRGMGV